MNPAQNKRALAKRAKRLLEDAGYELQKKQDGSFLVLDAETQETIVTFEDIKTLGEVFSFWGPPSGVFERDPETGLDPSNLAALRESLA